MHRILVVDDDTSTLRALRDLLVEGGYSVTVADDPLEALEDVKRKRYHLVLSDIRMPKMDGLDFVSECKKVRPGIPAMLMTAYSDLETAFLAGRQGAVRYMTKPIDAARLLPEVARAIRGETSAGDRRTRRHRVRPSVKWLNASEAALARAPLLEAYALGEARVVIGGKEVKDYNWPGQKPREMFFFMLTHRSKHRKEDIVEALWPDLPEEKTRSVFHSTLYKLRKALHPAYLVYTEKSYSINPRIRYQCDVEEFERLVDRARYAPVDLAGRVADLKQAIALYRGPFLSGFYSEWCTNHARELEQQYIKAMLFLAECYCDNSEFEEIIPLMDKLLSVDSYNEEAVRFLMLAYTKTGQPALARECYRRYERLASEELGSKPAPYLSKLYRSLADADPQAR